jgi:hypothetical protein
MKRYLISWTETVTRSVAVDAPDHMSAEDVEALYWGEISDAELVEAAQGGRVRRSSSPWDVTLASVDDVSLPDVSGPHDALADSYPVVLLADLLPTLNPEA